jgi:NAD(P)-dependent dehydrogenase (short-subunit alcohol dehydrogenase family)
VVLKTLMGPIQEGLIITTIWHTAEPPMWPPDEASNGAKNRLFYVLGPHLEEKGIPVAAVALGRMRTELMLTHHTMDELERQIEMLRFAAGGVAALPSGPTVMSFKGRLMNVSELAETCGITDLDGSLPRLNAQHLGREEESRLAADWGFLFVPRLGRYCLLLRRRRRRDSNP